MPFSETVTDRKSSKQILQRHLYIQIRSDFLLFTAINEIVF